MTPATDLMRINEVCAALRCSRSTVYRLLGAGRLTADKPIGRVLVDRRSVDELLRRPRQSA